MGKKGLLISIICSIVVVVVLGVSSLVHVFKHKEVVPPDGTPVVDQTINEGNNKGSKEDPYYIYDADTFVKFLSLYGSKEKNLKQVVKVPVMIETEENGEIVKTEKKDEDGNTIYEDKLDEFGKVVYEDVVGDDGEVIKEPYHFALYNDIDFTNVDYKTLFTDGTSFIGVFDGRGYSVKNISINVTTENFVDFIFTQGGESKKSYAHIGIFGDTNGAVIENIAFSNIFIFVSDDIYDYIQNDMWNDHKSSLGELTVGGLVACAENTTIKANVSVVINANSYGVYSEEQNTGRNFIGGVVGYAANGSLITNLDTGSMTTNITVDGKGSCSYIGGVVGGLYSSRVGGIDLTTLITSTSKDNTYYIGGIAGFVHTGDIANSRVNLTVKQVETEDRRTETDYIQNSILLEKYNGVGGIASVIRANNNEQLSTISNVKVFSNVDMDCFFGGAMFRVNSKDNDTTADSVYVTLTNVTLNSKVNVLKAYGVGFIIPHTKIEYTEDYAYSIAKNQSGVEKEYNILLTGSALIDSNVDAVEYSTSIISQNRSNASVVVNLKELKVLVSFKISEKFGASDTTSIQLNLYASFSYVD